MITNLHNPSGAFTDNETLEAVGKIASRVDARVLVDEVYLETLFEQRPQAAFHLGNEFIVTNSLTKAYGLSGLRCGWVIAEPALAERMWRLNDLFAATPVHIGENIAITDFELSPEEMRTISGMTRKHGRIVDFDWAPDWDKAA